MVSATVEPSESISSGETLSLASRGNGLGVSSALNVPRPLGLELSPLRVLAGETLPLAVAPSFFELARLAPFPLGVPGTFWGLGVRSLRVDDSELRRAPRVCVLPSAESVLAMEKAVDCSFSGLGVLNFRIEVILDGSTLPLRRVLRADFGEAWIGFLAGVVGPLLRLVLTVTLGCSCSSLTERRRRYEDTTGEGCSEVACCGNTRLRRGSDIAEEAEELESSVGISAAE